MKILYCVVGMGFYGIMEGDVLNRNGLIISAKRVFSVEADASQKIRSPKGDVMSFIISIYENVMMNCSFICDLSEKSPFYQRIMEIIEKEKANES